MAVGDRAQLGRRTRDFQLGQARVARVAAAEETRREAPARVRQGNDLEVGETLAEEAHQCQLKDVEFCVAETGNEDRQGWPRPQAAGPEGVHAAARAGEGEGTGP